MPVADQGARRRLLLLAALFALGGLTWTSVVRPAVSRELREPLHPGASPTIEAAASAERMVAGSAQPAPEGISQVPSPTALAPDASPASAAATTAPATGVGEVSGAPGPVQSEAVVRLMAVGDVMLARGIGQQVRADGPGIVFARAATVLAQADVLVANLECSIASANVGTRVAKHYTFRAPPAAADALSEAGVDVASQANNHALDFGPDALASTRTLLTERGIGIVGAGPDRDAAHAPLIVVQNGLRLAFLAYLDAFTESTGFNTREWEATAERPGVAIARVKDIADDVAAARSEADLVVVLIHAGLEGSSTPDREQRAYARAALSAGAALVMGTHPHVLQGYRLRGTTLVAFGVGNFVFDQMDDRERNSAVMDVTLTAAGVASLRWIPVRLGATGLPHLAYGTKAARIGSRLVAL